MPRIKNDNYPTPIKFAQSGDLAALHALGRYSGLNVFEPGCGDSAPHIALFDDSVVSKRVGIDICDDIPDIDGVDIFRGIDYIATPTDDIVDMIGGRQDIIITNPAYSFAKEFICKSLQILVEGGIAAFFLKLDFLGSKGRLHMFQELPLYSVNVFGSRPSFVKGEKSTTDMHNYGYYIFKDGFKGEPILRWFDF